MRLLLLCCGIAAAAGCTTVLTRDPLPAEKAANIAQVAPYGIRRPDLRFWGDTLTEGELEAIVRDRKSFGPVAGGQGGDPGGEAGIAWLTLSGGGPDGAFGAGILAGWTERGGRPEFRIVTGVSTGAIVALFAFLGPDYDATLRQIYTSYATRDLAARAILAGLLGGTALFDTRRYRALIDSYIDETVMERLARAHAEGRILLIGTTNLDAGRPMIWNVTAIAASRHPKARQLIGDVVQASSAIPAAFPPAFIPVEVDGRTYDEMHVDGGATQQVMLFSPQISVRDLDRKLGAEPRRTVYVIMNNKLSRRYEAVRPRLFSIAGTAISSLINGSGTGDIFRIFAVARREGIELRVVSIPPEFRQDARELFDPEYMRALYDFGFDMGRNGVDWLRQPPEFGPPG